MRKISADTTDKINWIYERERVRAQYAVLCVVCALGTVALLWVFFGR